MAEEAALERSRRLLAISRRRQTKFEADMNELNQRIREASNEISSKG
jgi:hypothetical protein